MRCIVPIIFYTAMLCVSNTPFHFRMVRSIVFQSILFKPANLEIVYRYEACREMCW